MFCDPAIVNENVAVTERGGASLSVTVMPNVAGEAAAVGVPESKPVLLSVKPAGRVEPLGTDQVYGDVPPVAAN